MALTATATKKIHTDILDILSMPDAVTLHINPDRPNISYNVVNVQGNWDSDEVLHDIFYNYICLINHPTGPTACPKVLVYCNTIDVVSTVFSYLQCPVPHPRCVPCPVAMFHGSTSDRNKKHVMYEFPKPDMFFMLLFVQLLLVWGLMFLIFVV